MYYFDYSATTPVNKSVLDEFLNHFLERSTELNLLEKKQEIKQLLKVNHDVLFTSGATESNNQAISGILKQYNPKDKHYHIITTKLEHSSIIETLSYYEKQGFIIDYVPLKNGIVTCENLIKTITPDTVLVTIASVSSELGILQPIDEIGKLLTKYPNIIFHSDMTQSFGKINVPLNNVDLITFTPHKFYGIKGIGVLLKKPEIVLESIFYGKKVYSYALVCSLVKALQIAIETQKENFEIVKKYESILIDELKKYEKVTINHPDDAIPHIINISVDCKPEVFQHALEQDSIYISTKSACSDKEEFSEAVLAYTNDLKLAKTSLRISVSPYTTDEEITYFINNFKKSYKKYIEEFIKKEN